MGPKRAIHDVDGIETSPSCDEQPLNKGLADVAAADGYMLLVAHR